MTKLRRDAYEIVDERSGGQCEMPAVLLAFESGPLSRCGGEAAQHQHRRPRGRGGSVDPLTETAANILGICPPCHELVESHRRFALENGWLVRSGQDPAAVPVLTWEGLVLLKEDGTTEPVRAAS